MSKPTAEEILEIVQSGAFEFFYEGEEFKNYIHGILDPEEEAKNKQNVLSDIRYLFKL